MHTQHTIGHFGDEALQAINSTGSDRLKSTNRNNIPWYKKMQNTKTLNLIYLNN